MVDKVFGSEFTDETNPTGSETISINNGVVLKDATLAAIQAKVAANATAKALEDNDKIGYHGDTAGALRSSTWSSIKATLKTYLDTLYAPIAKGVTGGDNHDHNGGDGAQINHTTLSNIGTNTHAQIDTFITSHDERHEWGGADEVDIRDLMMAYVYGSVFHNWASIAGFTASHSGTGTFTTGFLQGTASTGATNNSRVSLASAAALPIIGTNGFLANFRTKVNPSTVMTNCTVWLGIVTNPTAPTNTEHHIAFRIEEGVIYASCGNGSSGTKVSTGVTIGQFGVANLYFKERVGSIDFYVDGTLTNTLSTNLPNSGATPKLTFYMTNTTGSDRSMALLPYWYHQGTA